MWTNFVCCHMQVCSLMHCQTSLLGDVHTFRLEDIHVWWEIICKCLSRCCCSDMAKTETLSHIRTCVNLYLHMINKLGESDQHRSQGELPYMRNVASPISPLIVSRHWSDVSHTYLGTFGASQSISRLLGFDVKVQPYSLSS